MPNQMATDDAIRWAIEACEEHAEAVANADGSGRVFVQAARALRALSEQVATLTRQRDEQNAKCHEQFATICQMDTQRDGLRALIARLTQDNAALREAANV